MRYCLSVRQLIFLAAISVCGAVNLRPDSESCAAAIDVGAKKQLFIDEKFIESSRGIQLTMNVPYQAPEPILIPDQPWEKAIGLYSNIIKEGNKFRLWYFLIRKPSAKYCVAYAESSDGIHFTKPILNLVELNGSRANNVVILGEIAGCSVWIDPKAPPAQRYKTQSKFYPRDGRLNEFHIHASPDGIHWKLFAKPTYQEVTDKDTQSIIFWDQSVDRYVMYTRLWRRFAERGLTPEDRAQNKPNYRRVRRMESDDLLHWDNEQLVMKADEIDLATYKSPTGQPPVDYYGAAVFRYPDNDGVYIMLPQTYWHWKQRPPEPRTDAEAGVIKEDDHTDRRRWDGLAPSTIDVRLAVSRDGKSFKHLGGRKPFLKLGPEGSFSSRMVWAMPYPIRVGDELWIYYVGANRDHDRFPDPAASERLTGIGRAIMRLDGFVSADADYSGGEIVTPLIKFQGKTLELNLETSGGGSVKVELLDENDRPIAGYTKADATTLCGNSVRMPAAWGENKDLGKLAGKPIKLRFIMQDCKLYAFQFKD